MILELAVEKKTLSESFFRSQEKFGLPKFQLSNWLCLYKQVSFFLSFLSIFLASEMCFFFSLKIIKMLKTWFLNKMLHNFFSFQFFWQENLCNFLVACSESFFVFFAECFNYVFLCLHKSVFGLQCSLIVLENMFFFLKTTSGLHLLIWQAYFGFCDKKDLEIFI